MKKSVNFEDIKQQWMLDPEFKQAYKDLELEYEIALELIQARITSGLTQEEIANRMGTKQSVIARLESGNSLPSVKTLTKYAHATGKQLHFNLGT